MTSPRNGRTSRFAAIETLHRLQRTKLPMSRLFEQIVEACRLTSIDRQLAMHMAHGVLRQRDYLDQLLAHLCSRPLNQIKPFVYQALCVGLYQLFFMDRIPPSAAVDETVKALKAARYPKPIQGFVNGVLRQSQRRREELPKPQDPAADGLPPLNHPAWLTERWQRRFGRQIMQEICDANNREPLLCLRVSPDIGRTRFLEALDARGINAAPGTFAPDAVVLPGFHGSITGLPGFIEGHFQVQDQAAQIVSLLLAPFKQSGRYLDCCAGLGGKTVHLAALLAGLDASLIAVEPDPGRYRLLQTNLARMGASGLVKTVPDSLERFARSCRVNFDGILVDAPCSGTGVIGRHPDIRWNREQRDILAYRKRQLRLLHEAADLLAPEGVLVYATCSIEAEENHEVIERFLEQQSDFSLSDCRDILPAASRPLTQDGCFSPLPGPGIDGFFGARLIRNRSND